MKSEELETVFNQRMQVFVLETCTIAKLLLI